MCTACQLVNVSEHIMTQPTAGRVRRKSESALGRLRCFSQPARVTRVDQGLRNVEVHLTKRWGDGGNRYSSASYSRWSPRAPTSTARVNRAQ